MSFQGTCSWKPAGLGTQPGRVSHCVPPTSMWSLLCSGLNQGPFTIRDRGSQVCLLCPSRPISPALWGTLTLKTFQEALLRGNRTHGDWKGPGGRGKVQRDCPALLSVPQPCRARAEASPGACVERAGPSQEAGLGPALPAPAAAPAVQVRPEAAPEGGWPSRVGALPPAETAPATPHPGALPKHWPASHQGRSAPAGPGTPPGPAAAPAVLRPAAGPVPAPHLAPPPALLPPAAACVSRSEQGVVREFPGNPTVITTVVPPRAGRTPVRGPQIQCSRIHTPVLGFSVKSFGSFFNTGDYVSQQ